MENKPTGVMVIAIVHVIAGVPWVAIGIWILMASADITRMMPYGTGQDVAKYLLPAAILALGIGAGYIATGIGLWNLRNWARAAAVAIAGISLVGLVVAMVNVPFGFSIIGGPTLVYAAIEIAIIYYLLMPTTAARFGGVAMTSQARRICPTCGRALDPAWNSCPYCGPVRPTVPPPVAPAPTQAIPEAVNDTVIIDQKPPAMAWLAIKSGSRAGTTLRLKQGDTDLGRSATSNDHAFDDETVSERHARVRWQDGQFYLHDLASKNGTFVNGQRIDRPQPLRSSDTIAIGRTELVFMEIKDETKAQ